MLDMGVVEGRSSLELEQTEFHQIVFIRISLIKLTELRLFVCRLLFARVDDGGQLWDVSLFRSCIALRRTFQTATPALYFTSLSCAAISVNVYRPKMPSSIGNGHMTLLTSLR